jgi:hypothetical protein
MIDDQMEIEECISTIRARMRFGFSKQKIATDLGRFFNQEMIFLCYQAAVILENASKE